MLPELPKCWFAYSENKHSVEMEGLNTTVFAARRVVVQSTPKEMLWVSRLSAAGGSAVEKQLFLEFSQRDEARINEERARRDRERARIVRERERFAAIPKSGSGSGQVESGTVDAVGPLRPSPPKTLDSDDDEVGPLATSTGAGEPTDTAHAKRSNDSEFHLFPADSFELARKRLTDQQLRLLFSFECLLRVLCNVSLNFKYSYQ